MKSVIVCISGFDLLFVYIWSLQTRAHTIVFSVTEWILCFCFLFVCFDEKDAILFLHPFAVVSIIFTVSFFFSRRTLRNVLLSMQWFLGYNPNCILTFVRKINQEVSCKEKKQFNHCVNNTKLKTFSSHLVFVSMFVASLSSRTHMNSEQKTLKGISIIQATFSIRFKQQFIISFLLLLLSSCNWTLTHIRLNIWLIT